MTYRSKLIIFLLLLCGLAINLLTILTWDTSLIGNDGIQYLSTAKNWLAGNGFSTNVLMYAPHFQGVLPAAQTVWPPGLPFAVALTSKLGISVEAAVLVLNVFMHASAALLMWLVLLKLGVTRFFAAICAFAFYFLALPWSYVSAGLAEPLVTALTLGSLLLLPTPYKSRLVTWVSCGLILAACIYVRYSNVFLAFGTGTGIFIYLLMYERSSFSALIQPLLKLTVMLSLPVAIFGYLMYRTSTLIGTLDRYSGFITPETIASTAKRWISKTSELLGFTSNTPEFGTAVTSLFLIFMTLVLVMILAFLAGSDNYLRRSYKKPVYEESLNNDKTVDYFRLATLATLFHCIALVAYLSIQSLKSVPLEIITRYLYQIYPCFYAIFCAMLYTLFKRYAEGKKRTLLTAATSVVLGLYLVAQPNSLLVTRGIYFSESSAASEMMALPATESRTLQNFIQRCFEDSTYGKSIWSTHGQPIHLHTGLPTLTQNVIYTNNPFDAKQMQERVSEYQVGMFLFVNFPKLTDQSYINYMTEARKWLVENGYQKVSIPTHSFGLDQTVDIYTADPECGI